MTALRRPHGTPIDWASVRARLERAGHTVAAHPTPEQAQALLEERARALAQLAVQQETSTSAEVIVFRVATEGYAIPVAHVLEVARLHEVAPIPGAPRPFAGITSLRGDLVPLLDLADFLGSGRGATGVAGASQPTFLVIGAQGAELGLIADEVLGVEPLEGPDLFAPPANARGAGHEARPILRGPTEGGLLVIDVEALLADERLIVDHQEKGTAGRATGEERE